MKTGWLRLIGIFVVPVLVIWAAPVEADGGGTGTAGPASISLSLSFQQPQIEEVEGPLSLGSPGGRPAARLRFSGLSSLTFPGKPALPFKTVNLLITAGREIQDIKVVRSDRVVLGKFYIPPGQRPSPISGGEPAITGPDETVYGSDQPYPGEAFFNIGVQWQRGYQVLVLNLYPVEYMPKTGETSYFKGLEVTVTTRQAEQVRSPLFRGLPEDRDLIAQKVDNPQELAGYDAAADLHEPQSLNGGEDYDYLIITNSTLHAAPGPHNFQALKAHKDARGVLTEIQTVENIYATMSGTDNQDKIRNYILQEYTDHNISYVLLGGDADGGTGQNIVPARALWGMPAKECAPPNIPGDIYYACLDGTWDGDLDGIYGEQADTPDLSAEVYVGRAPVDNAAELANFVRKTIAYELAGTDVYLNHAWLIGTMLDGSTHGIVYKREVNGGSSEHGYNTTGIPDSYVIGELSDQGGGGLLSSHVTPLINSNIHFINHIGHSFPNSVMSMGSADVQALTNTGYCFVYSQGCYAADFDNRGVAGDPAFGGCSYLGYDCIGEEFVTSPGGAFAFIGNSRFGWYEPASTNGPSQIFDRYFWDAIFAKGYRNLGRANQESKEALTGLVTDDYYRWCYYDLNLLGDPETSLHPASGGSHWCPDYTQAMGAFGFIGGGVAQGWKHDCQPSNPCHLYALPFTFPFYGKNYSQVYISVNGFIDFTNSSSPYIVYPRDMQSRVVIAPMWDMIDTDGFVQPAEDIYIHQPSADSVCIRWKGESLSNSRNAEVVLYMDGRIRFNYGANSGGAFDPTIGISAGNMRCYFLYNEMYSNISLNNVRSILYTPVAAGTRHIMGNNNPESRMSSSVAQGNRLYLFSAWTWETGDVNALRVKAAGPGNIKMAVYADSGGQPGGLLRSVNSGQPLKAAWDGWNEIPITPLGVTKWTNYWIGFITDTAIVRLDDSTPSYRWKAVSYAGFSFPGTLTGLTTATGSRAFVQGWIVMKPPAPVLSYPGADASISGASITFQWNASSGATRYWLTVQKVSDGTNIFNAPVGNVTSYGVNGFLNDGTQYRWAVAAGNAAGWTSSAFRTFYSGAASKPPAPVLTYPGAGAYVGGASITFQWNASSGATRYWLTVQKVSGGTYIINTAIGNVTSYGISGFLNDGTQYRWAVAAGNAAGWTSSAFRTFYSGAASKPDAPLLSYPGVDNSVGETDITFQWNASSGATRYWLTVQKISDGSYVYNTAVGLVTSYVVVGFPKDGTQYRWAVAAGNFAGWTSSAWRSFYSGAPAKPPAPVLTYPGAGASVGGVSITFQWSASSGATRYWLTVQKVSDGTNIFNAPVGNVTSYGVNGFPNNGTQYKWAVAAGNAAGWTSSAWRLFTNGP